MKKYSFIEIPRWWPSTYQNAARIVQEADRWVDWPLLQLFILESKSLVLAVDGEAQSTFVHIKEYAEDALSFEAFAVLSAMHI